LVKLLKDTDSDVRAAAAWALGEIPPRRKEFIQALIDALADTEPTVREEAAAALGECGAAALDAKAPLQKLLKDANEDVQQAAADALRQLTGRQETGARSTKDETSAPAPPKDKNQAKPKKGSNARPH
jgi:HEAT repeat protein